MCTGDDMYSVRVGHLVAAVLSNLWVKVPLKSEKLIVLRKWLSSKTFFTFASDSINSIRPRCFCLFLVFRVLIGKEEKNCYIPMDVSFCSVQTFFLPCWLHQLWMRDLWLCFLAYLCFAFRSFSLFLRSSWLQFRLSRLVWPGGCLIAFADAVHQTFLLLFHLHEFSEANCINLSTK